MRKSLKDASLASLGLVLFSYDGYKDISLQQQISAGLLKNVRAEVNCIYVLLSLTTPHLPTSEYFSKKPDP